jgi:putative membrane protein
MMYWGNGVGAWGMVLMTVSTLLFWGLVVAGVVALVRYTSGNASQGGATPEAASPRRILAERFARGEIDEEEYMGRLQVLNGAPRRGPGG